MIGHGHGADRQVDVERPAPAEVVDEKAAEHRAAYARHRESHSLIAHPATELASRNDVCRHRHRHRAEAAAAEPLNEARSQQLVHRLGDPAGHRSDDEENHRAEQDALAAELVAELAVQRHDDDLSQQIRRGHPRHPRESAQILGDGGQRRGDDRAVERGHHHGQLQAYEDDDGLPRNARGHRSSRRRTIGKGHPTDLRIKAQGVRKPG